MLDCLASALWKAVLGQSGFVAHVSRLMTRDGALHDWRKAERRGAPRGTNGPVRCSVWFVSHILISYSPAPEQQHTSRSGPLADPEFGSVYA